MRLHSVQALLAIIFWGASFVATKVVLQELSPITLVTLRFALGLVVLWATVVARRSFTVITGRELAWLAGLGAIGIFVHQMLQANGLLTTSATNSGWLVALTPVFTALLARALLGEAFGPARVAGLVIAFAGAVVIVVTRSGNVRVLGLPATPGDFLLLISALNWAVFTVLSKPVLARHPPTVMMAYVMLLGWLMLLPFFAAAGGWSSLAGLSRAGWAGLLFLGLLCSGLAYIFWYGALQVGDASQVAAFLYLEPLVTLLTAAVVLGEPVTAWTLAGGTAVLVGVWLVNRPGA